MRREIHGSAELRVSRNTLLKRALDEADADLSQLAEYVSGQVGLIGTDDNPFGLFRELEGLEDARADQRRRGHAERHRHPRG